MILFLVLFVPFLVTLFVYAKFLNWAYDKVADWWLEGKSLAHSADTPVRRFPKRF